MLMADAYEVRDTPDALARLCGCSESELADAFEEIAKRGVADTEAHDDGTWAIRSRRLARYAETRLIEREKKRVQRGVPTIVPTHVPLSVPALSQMAHTIVQEEDSSTCTVVGEGVQREGAPCTTREAELYFTARGLSNAAREAELFWHYWNDRDWTAQDRKGNAQRITGGTWKRRAGTWVRVAQERAERGLGGSPAGDLFTGPAGTPGFRRGGLQGGATRDGERSVADNLARAGWRPDEIRTILDGDRGVHFTADEQARLAERAGDSSR
jgi:hypothetical protein